MFRDWRGKVFITLREIAINAACFIFVFGVCVAGCWFFLATMAKGATLEEAICFEGGNQPFKGQVAIGLVILERTESKDFPNTISEVISQDRNPYDGKCQFSYMCDGKPEVNNGICDMESARKAALFAINLKYALGFKFKALYYRAKYSKAKWGKNLVADIGDHLFFERY